MHIHTHYAHAVCRKLVQHECFKIIISKSDLCTQKIKIIGLHNNIILLDLVILSNALLVVVYVVTFDGELLKP